MAITQVRNFQFKDLSLTQQKLVLDFLNGSDWNITNGANNATITGLAEGVNPNDAVNFAQLQEALSATSGAVQLRGGIAGTADLTGNSTGNTYADSDAGYLKGDKFFITSDGTVTVSDGSISVHAGDAIIISEDVASDAAITLADVFKIDNTESADLIRVSDVVDSLTSTDVAAPLSANQGRVLDERLSIMEALGLAFGEEVIGEQLTVTTGSASVSGFVNVPKPGTEKVYLNGMRQLVGAGNDYTIVAGVVTFSTNLDAACDTVVVDYRK